MNYEIVEMTALSGKMAKVYSIIPEGEETTLFEQFIETHQAAFRAEIKEILSRLKQIGQTTGAREGFFKHEGNRTFVRQHGKFVWALYDDEAKNLRLYCIRFGTVAIILGGGGYKAKSVIKWQEDENLTFEVERIMAYAISISKQLKSGDLYWSADGSELEGNFKHNDDEH